MEEKKNRSEFLIMVGLIVASVAIRFYFSDFAKTIFVYGDELRYYGIAKSIYEGAGLTFRNCRTDYQKVLYSLLLTPAFIITDGVKRVSVISLINCITMTVSVIPVWLIAKELNLKKYDRIAVSIITLIFPDMVYSMTFMSEILYWPLFMIFIYLWVISVKRPSILKAVLSGFVCYLGYMCKEIFLALVIAAVLFEFVYPVVDVFVFGKSRDKAKQILSEYNGSRLFTLIMGITFAICHVLLKLTVFSGLGNSYNQMGLAAIAETYNKLYLIFAFFYYLVAVFLTLLVIPLLFPIIHYDHFEETDRKVLVYIVNFILVTAATVAYTISVREDLGATIPRLHLRYVAPAFVIIVLLFIKSLDIVYASSKCVARLSVLGRLYLIMTFFIFFIFKGVMPGIVDQFSLIWYYLIQEKYGAIALEGKERIIYLNAIIVLIVMLAFGVMAYVSYKSKNAKRIKVFSLATIIILCCLSGHGGRIHVMNAYKKKPKRINAVVRLSDYMSVREGNVLYLTSGAGLNEQTRYFDTYFEPMDRAYVINMPVGDGNSASFNVSEMNFREATYGSEYDTPDTIDYIVVESTVEMTATHLENVVELQDLNDKYFTVYENLNPTRISFVAD